MKRAWLTELRKHNGLTQAELAARVGASSKAIAAIEQGRRKPRPDLAKSIANKLGFDWRRFNGIERDQSPSADKYINELLFDQLLNEIREAKKLKKDALSELRRVFGRIEMAFELEMLPDDKYEILVDACIKNGIQDIRFHIN